MEREDAIRVIIENLANVLQLKNKGRIEKGMDADIVLVDDRNYEIQTVISKGIIMCRDGAPVIEDMFE